MICQCCNGTLPPREVWEANRHKAGECTGSVDRKGRCRAFSADELWQSERQRVADPNYTPTLDEALRSPDAFVDGMTEE